MIHLTGLGSCRAVALSALRRPGEILKTEPSPRKSNVRYDPSSSQDVRLQPRHSPDIAVMRLLLIPGYIRRQGAENERVSVISLRSATCISNPMRPDANPSQPVLAGNRNPTVANNPPQVQLLTSLLLESYNVVLEFCRFHLVVLRCLCWQHFPDGENQNLEGD